MKLKTLNLVILLFMADIAHAQISKLWESRYSETGYDNESVQDVITDVSGNIFVFGHTESDALLIKYDKTGKLIWTFQGGRGVILEAHNNNRSFTMDAQGNFYLTLEGQYWARKRALVKVNKDGQLAWKKEFPAVEGKAVLTAALDGSCYIFYKKEYGTLSFAKYSPTGDVLWSKEFNATDEKFVHGIKIIGTTTFIWGYTTYQTYGRTSMLYAYNAAGTNLWSHEYKYEIAGTSFGTTPLTIDADQNTLYVSYYADAGGTPDARTIIAKYNFTTGLLLVTFATGIDEPGPLFVGSDQAVYIVDYSANHNIDVRKFSNNGTLVFTNSFDLDMSWHYVQDHVIDKETNTIDLLVKSVDTNPNTTFRIVSFKPNKTHSTRPIVSSKSTYQPTALAVDGEQNDIVVGSFDNGIYNKDLLVTKVSLWERAFVPSNTLYHSPSAVTMDAQGNTYVAGVLMAPPDMKYYGVIKYDVSGKQLWATKIELTNATPSIPNDSRALAIAVNVQGEIFVTGGLDLVGDDYMAPAIDIYTVKLNADGGFLWKAKTSGITDDLGKGFQLSLDSFGNVYVFGVNTNGNDYGIHNKMVLLKYNTSGTLMWEQKFGRYVDYHGFSTSAPDSNAPKLKIFNDEIYVLSVSVVGDYPNATNSVEMRKFDLAGTEILNHEITVQETMCPSCPVEMFARDVTVDANKNIYILYNHYGVGAFKRKLRALSPNGTILWENTREHANFDEHVSDGSIALGTQNELYIVTASMSKFEYSKISNTGVTLWGKEEVLNGYLETRGNPCFAFVKSDDNPVFISTNLNDTYSHYFFISERNKVNGNETHREIFDGPYDHEEISEPYGWNELLMAAYKNPSADEFVMTGGIHDKNMSSETIVTLKYGVESLKASFSGSTQKAIEGTAITFNDNSTGTPTQWEWTFDGGIPSVFSGRTPPPVSYSTPGMYSVKLKVTNATSNNELTKTEYVEILQKLSANFTVLPASPKINTPINFTNTSVGPVSTWLWTFAGASISSSNEQSPHNILFTTPGLYNISLTVSNDIDTHIITKQITVSDVLPVANFSISDSEVIVGEEIDFTDSSTGTISSRVWIFEGANITSSTFQSPQNITYASAGVYNVTLTVGNSAGTHSVTKQLTVKALDVPVVVVPVIANFIISNIEPDVNEPIHITDASSSNVTTWGWTFEGANISTSSEKSPSNIVFDTPGVYSIRLIASNGIHADTLQKMIKVKKLTITDVETTDESVHVYPTIVRTSFHLQVNNPGAVRNLKLLNSVGKVVAEPSPAHTDFNMSTYQAGVYVVMICYDGEWVIRRIVKEP